MYIPKYNLITDTEEIVAFIKQFSFATIITAKKNYPTATHLPFIFSTRNDKIILTSHFARANDHWQDIENTTSLVIFSEPHAYISPKHYDNPVSVPTWNYISVHAYGQGKLITDSEETFVILEETIMAYETEYKKQWDSLPMDYKLKMQKGIVAFEIEVNDLQGKKKLSQNKAPTEQQRIIENLSKSASDNENQIASYMKINLSANMIGLSLNNK
ncbi:MAG: FMN-binding negative transcriptional regulator [Adhaeribacter sp.]|nr:FMN-binding negative transcriptional regulator [Adhaeribacter sp.]